MKEKKVDKYIINALFELLTVKQLADISATELIAKAGVCRSSYYRNFYILEDVIKAYGKNLFERFAGIPQHMDEPRRHMRLVYEQYLSERDKLSILDKRNLLYIIEDSLFDYCSVRINNLSIFKGKYRAEFYAGASAALIRAWIHSGFKESPQEMADITYSLIYRTETQNK